MSVASPKSSEPSMEEILASIRKIIADDQPSPAKAPELERPAPAPAPVQLAVTARAEPAKVTTPVAAVVEHARPVIHEEVLDLDDEPYTSPPGGQTELEDDIMFIEREEEPELAPAVAAVPPAVPAVQPAPAPAVDAGLLSAQTDAAVSHAFQNLAGSILAGSQRTLDDVVKDLLRPMLKMWLDDNLPSIVERLVRAEIERVARGGR